MPVDNLQTMLAQLAVLDPAAPDRQFEAAIALPKMAAPENRAAIVVALRGALTAAHSLTRAHAAEGLGILQATEAQPDLVHALEDRYQLVRSYAARALGKIGDPAAIEPLIAVLSGDSFFGARAEAAASFKRDSGEYSEAMSAFNSTLQGLRQAVYDGIGSLTQRARG